MSNDDKWPRVDYKFVNDSVQVKRIGRHDDTAKQRLITFLMIVTAIANVVSFTLQILSRMNP